MQLARPSIAQHPFQFGRGRVWDIGPAVAAVRANVSDDLKLFATTFAAGFLFVSLLIG